MIQTIFRILNQFAVEIPTLPVDQFHSHLTQFLKECQAVLGMPSRREGPPSIWDTHGISGNVFANPDASSSASYPQELNPGSSRTEEPLYSSTVEKSERQTQDQDQRYQSGQSAKKICHLQWRRLFKELWRRPTTTADFASSFCQIHHASNVCLLEDKIQY